MHTEIHTLWLPVLLSSVALFFASFLSWMVFQLHAKDWGKLDNEDEFLAAARKCDLKPGNYSFPGCTIAAERNSEGFKAKMEAGPRGFITLFANTGMAKSLVLTFIYFLVVNYCLAYLTALAFYPGADYFPVFRFVATAAFLVYLSAIVSHSIWFRCRIVGHVIESVAYAAIVGVIFAAMWPGHTYIVP